MTKVKGLLAGVAVAGALLMPLYGDPRQSPVTHPEWARMLLRALELEEIAKQGGQASVVFQSLAWRTNLSYDTARHFRAVGVDYVEGPPSGLVATASAGEVAYRLAAARGGDYRVRLRGSGDAHSRIAVEITRAGEASPLHSFQVAPVGLVEGAAGYLSPGLYTVALGLPAGARLEGLELIPPCLNPIEPRGGWHATAISTTADVAVTALKALDLEHELAPAASPLEVSSATFQPVTGLALPAAFQPGLTGFWLRGGESGLQAAATVDLREPGLYTVYAFGLAGAGQSWLADACQKAVMCPTSDAHEAPRWRPVLTADFSAGRHSLGVTLGKGAAVQRLRFERKREAVEDYLAAAARIGLDLGSQSKPIPRRQAAEAMRFVEARRRQLGFGANCGDVVLPPTDTLVASGLAQLGGSIQQPGQAPLNSGTGPAPLGVGPLPVDPPPSTLAPTVVVPTTEPSPPPSDPPPTTTLPPPPTTLSVPPTTLSVPPTTLPGTPVEGPPPTIPPQPPASPVVIK
jgi:hypothetical protein